MPIFYFIDGDRHLTVNFRRSLNKAVLKFYPAAKFKASAVSSACLWFDVYISSPAVELLIAVWNTSEDSTDITMGKVRSDNGVNRLQQVDTGSQSITVLHGQQYVLFIAKKIKATTTLDRVEIKKITYEDGSCKKYGTCKYIIYAYDLLTKRYEISRKINLFTRDLVFDCDWQ